MKLALILFGMMGLVMLIGCGGGGDDEAVTEPTPETRLQIQNEEGDRFVSGMLAYESGMRELNATLAQKGYDMATLAALTPETLRNYFSETETDALLDTIGLYVDTPANDASAAIDALIAQETLLQGSVATEARGGGLILAGLGAITAADILLPRRVLCRPRTVRKRVAGGVGQKPARRCDQRPALPHGVCRLFCPRAGGVQRMQGEHRAQYPQFAGGRSGWAVQPLGGRGDQHPLRRTEHREHP